MFAFIAMAVVGYVVTNLFLKRRGEKPQDDEETTSYDYPDQTWKW